jgi:hypothetical protein
MSVREVEKELGKPDSRMAAGNQEILNYANEGKLLFVGGALSAIDGVLLIDPALKPAESESPRETVQSDTQLLEALPSINEDQTITQSAQQYTTTLSEQFAEDYDYTKISSELEDSIKDYEAESRRNNAPTELERLTSILIAFSIEVVITLIVLKIAFQVCGFPALWRQLIPLSIAVALAGAMVSYVFHVGSLNPVSIGLSFILLLILIRQMTDVREWTTAIQIAVTARLVSIVLMWLAFAGAMVLFGV